MQQKDVEGKNIPKSLQQHSVYQKLKNMQNDYIIYGNKYIQDSVYLWGMKGGREKKGYIEGSTPQCFTSIKKKSEANTGKC